MKLKIALAVAATLAVGSAFAAEPQESSAQAKVGAMTGRVVEAIKTGSLAPLTGGTVKKGDTVSTNLATVQPPLAQQRPALVQNGRAADAKPAPKENEGQNAPRAEGEAYPQVPARWLRPQSKPDNQKTAVERLKQAAQSAPPPQREFDKVKINTNAVIAMKPGANVLIPISKEHPNRIITPFTNPQVISTTLQGGRRGECGEVCVRDGIIYVTTDTLSTAFITDKGHEDIAFSITMVPQPIPPREVRFTLPDSTMEDLQRTRITGGAAQAQAWEVTQPYVETLKKSMRAVALGEVPDGYTLRSVRAKDRLPDCRHAGLDIDFTNGQVLEGYNLMIYVGVMTNKSSTPVEFRNQACGSWRNAAVTSWPLTLLRPGQQTEIYIAVKKGEEIPADRIRKPLIRREFN